MRNNVHSPALGNDMPDCLRNKLSVVSGLDQGNAIPYMLRARGAIQLKYKIWGKFSGKVRGKI